MTSNFEKLEIWQKAHQLTIEIYILSRNWPKAEVFGLTSQIRRAAASVELNIVEGQSRFHYSDKVNFFYNARASAEEVRNCLLLAKDLDEFDFDEKGYNVLSENYLILIKMINAFITYTKSRKSAQLLNSSTN